MGTLRSTLQSCLPPLPFGLPFGLRLPSTGCLWDTGLRVATVESTCLLVERILILSDGAEVGKPVVDRRVRTELWVVPRVPTSKASTFSPRIRAGIACRPNL